MAQYKVPQDVEADDKLLGPLNFRQFIYLLVVAGLVVIAWALAQVFPVLAILPAPFALFFLLLALPLKKDQPMETYLAALLSFYTKPSKRFFNPGQRESTIDIITPKAKDAPLTRDLTSEEASHRLSFLADIVDSEGYSIKGDFPPQAASPVRDDIFHEATNAPDIYDSYSSQKINQRIVKDTNSYHQKVVDELRAAINNNSRPNPPAPHAFAVAPILTPTLKTPQSSHIVEPVSPQLTDLSTNADYSVATIQQEAARVQEEKTKPKPSSNNDSEVYIRLH